RLSRSCRRHRHRGLPLKSDPEVCSISPRERRYRGTMTPSVDQILALVSEYAGAAHAPRAFDPQNPRVPASGRVFGPEEVVELVRTSLDFWLTAGPEARVFERDLARHTGQRHAL